MIDQAQLDEFRIKPGSKFKLRELDPAWMWTAPDSTPEEVQKHAGEFLAKSLERLSKEQERLWAQDQFSLLVVLQAMDAAGKDGMIKHVMSGLNPQGCSVHSFKQPSEEELDHDFLWRCNSRLPRRGEIGIFNRSHYEEVLVVKVHQEFLNFQRLPKKKYGRKFWQQRYESINDFERHVSRNGTAIVKIFLNISREEQKRRFMERLDNPEKNYKFSATDVKEREHWEDYMSAYQEALRATSTRHAPWYVIPADHKWVSRTLVAGILAETIAALPLKTPAISPERKESFEQARKQLEAEA
jgi:PPK2 family polyphosphate:nucleotide phosphotransferase